MRKLTLILLLAALLTMAFDFQPFTQMIEFPRDLDDLYAKIEAQEYGYTWSDCTPGEVVGAYVTWAQVREIAAIDDGGRARVMISRERAQAILTGVSAAGDIDASESEIFRLLLLEFFRSEMLSCGVDGYPTLYGAVGHGVGRSYSIHLMPISRSSAGLFSHST